ncbi:hypothetical protein QCA50_000185 [Cerrena zonata]|uniref:C2H2-type domain-containing protein n=1 Tax=Cerrena zonata TaxID=2478898 RepID=A0AAW0GUA2_9APHY
MSSWSGSAYPPPPRGRSRSRSPYRGSGSSYPPPRSYPESGYPPQDVRDWEAYDRDRAWANYERERAAYEYSRRGRSRSPPPEEAGRKRRRSLSPWERDRYEPRPRYGDDYDTHSRSHGYTSPHRGPYPPPYGSSRRAPPDPHTLDYPATLKQYAEWFRYYFPSQAAEEDSADKAAEQEAGDGSKPRNGIRARWEKYRKEFSAQQLQRMFDHHRKSPWFAEKYDPSPELAALRARVRRVGWRGRIDTFLLDLEAGKFDPDLHPPEPEPEPTSPIKEETNGDSAANGAESGAIETPVEESKPTMTGDDDMTFNAEAEEENDQDANRAGNNKQNDDRRGKSGEEVSVPTEGNQVMIRTIPPDIGRVKLEEACSKLPGYIYLALGDPLQKRNYYRAGWLRFREDADIPTVVSELSEKKIEGFKLHVAHIVKPFVSRVRYTPEAASRPERLTKDLNNARILATTLEDEYTALRQALADAKAQKSENGAEVKDESEDVTMSETINADEEEDPEPRERGSDAVERRIEKVMTDMKEQGLLDGVDEEEVEAKRTVVALDLYLAYLRAAFHTCYYCAVVTDHVEELHRKCVKHVRKALIVPQETKTSDVTMSDSQDKVEGEAVKEEEKEKEKVKEPPTRERQGGDGRDWKRNDERWLDWLDSKIALLINRNGVDPKDYGGKSFEEELSKAAEPHIKQEDEGKFRCKNCQKLFKATTFVEKHIANKHPELVKHLDEIPYFNNFALDPHHIQPFTHPPQPVGNVQPPPQAYGLQGPAFPPGEYGRPPFHQPPHGPYPPPYANANGGYYDPYAYAYHPAPYPPQRREEAVTARRLSDRISGFAPGYDQNIEIPAIPASAGLPAKPIGSLDAVPGKRGGRNNGGAMGPLPPPPPDAKEDPRAAAGRKVSYHDMDLVAEGDVELTY